MGTCCSRLWFWGQSNFSDYSRLRCLSILLPGVSWDRTLTCPCTSQKLTSIQICAGSGTNQQLITYTEQLPSALIASADRQHKDVGYLCSLGAERTMKWVSWHTQDLVTRVHKGTQAETCAWICSAHRGKKDPSRWNKKGKIVTVLN
jgi:hypothetical protein